ncbi:hypothetical protein BDA96_07G203400 [Sorghum bicolor]|uniref:Protein kinase domain-containing protein n=1 Tax=Sorghum bicolor TaxID=4558 RepID=A0A921UB77_SORBI|nr:hypothetical protein BDA96_07G203400 [Sorghum bicolor]
MDHPYIVKLLGCCSDSILVYFAECTCQANLDLLDIVAKCSPGSLKFNFICLLRNNVASEIKLQPYWCYVWTYLSPKISDFGTSKIAPAGDELIAVASGMVGMFGYISPEISNQTNVTVMTDIYSFGVVLLELITGKTAIDDSNEGEERNLVYWKINNTRESVWYHILLILHLLGDLQQPVVNYLLQFVVCINAKLQDGKFEELLDPMLRGSVSKKVLTKAPIAYKCTMKEDVDRPKIQNVIDDLDRVIYVSLSCDDTPGASSSAAR